ncbi:F-box-like/WD repeat-containing protein TBL1Y [Daphnia pulex]|uniref:F-box-like/WD repeat-containing protein TBL1Y n=1 Tax=Daphnia pulex TaxID=6669 RepID=UPI001EDEA247|nr:F-box-like/WD repeat-containing protein TBL1Y [Daphnia pulex]
MAKESENCWTDDEDDDCERDFRKTGQTCYKEERLSDGEEKVFDCAFHPSQPVLACGLSSGSIRLFRGHDEDTPFARWTPDDRFRVDASSHIHCLAWNVDGTRLAAGCFDGTVVVWHYNNSDISLIPFQAKEHNLAVFAVIWNRWNRNLFASRSRDEGKLQRILIWNSDLDDLYDCECLELGTKFVWDFEWISSTRLAASTYEGSILICDTGTDVPISRLFHSGVFNVRWHFALQYIVSCSTDGSIKVWSKKRYKDVGNIQLDNRIYCVDCHGIRSGEAALIASGLEDGTVVIWHVTENRFQTLNGGHSDAVTRVSFSPDGQYLASLDNEEKLIIWSTKNWVIIFQHIKSISEDWSHIRWNPTSNKLAISTNSSQVHVFELEDEFEDCIDSFEDQTS